MTTVRDAAAGPQNTPEDKVRGTADAFKAFTTAERSRMQQAQTSEHASRRMEKNVKLNDLKKFAENFKLASPIPDDLVSLLAKDRDKQIEIQQAAESNARNAKAGASEQGEESTASVSSSQGQPHVVTGTRGAAGEQHPLHAGSGSGRPRYRPTTVYADPVAPMADRSEPYTGKPIALYPFLPPQPTNTPIPMEEEVSTTRAPSYELSTTYANAAAPLPYQSVANTDEATAHAGMLPLLPPQLHDTPEPTGEGWSATWDSTSGQPQSSGRPYIQFGEMGPSGVPKYYKDEVIHRPSYVSHRRRSRDDEGVGLQMPKRAYMQFGAMLSESENLESVRSLEPASLRFYDVPDPDAMDSNTVGQASLAPTYVHEFPSKLPESQVQYTPLPRKSREILSGETAAAQLASPVATSPAGDSDTDTQDDSSSVAHAQSTTLPSSAAAHRMPNAHTSASKLENDGSVWSDDGLEPLTRLRLIDRLCARIERDMKHTITTSAHTDATRLALAHRLAELLKQFSILLDNRAMQGMQHRSTVFVRAQRSLIVEGLMGAVESKRMKVDDMSVVDKMSLWRQLESNASDLPHDIDLSQLAAEPDDEGPELDAADFPEAERFLTEGPAYTWLVRHLDCILNDTFLSTGEEEESIRATLLDSINDKSVRSRRIMQVTLRLPWNPLQFLHEQYGTPSQAKLVDAICLVGLPHIAFATTCLNYAQRLWPEFGPEVLRCLDDLCIQARDIKVATSMNVRSPRGFTLSFRHDGPNALFWDFIAYSACPVTLLEVGEVLCWLASTCRSHVEGVVGHVSPKLVKQGDWHVLTIESLAMPQKATDEDAAATGMCWTTMFYNPVLVRGYPVPGRSNDEPGLEILVDLMTVLGAAHRATIFDNVLVLKGFCTLFVHIIRNIGSSVWHFLRSDDMSWLCYSKAKQFATCEASFDHLNVGRHFVGFAHEGYCTAGVKDAKYNAIGFAGEKYSTSGFALDGVSINVAKYVGIGTKLMAGNKDSAVLHAYNGPVPYRRKVAQAANINVVLYGADDRRAWFLDGASALLQLSRAALTHHRALDIREDFDITKFCHGTPEVLPARTAKDVLLDMTNRNLDLEGDGTYTFQSLVEGYLEVLLEILSHQIKLKCSETKQWQLRGIGTSRLEGFSFVDLLCAKPATQPRYIDLGKYGSNWLQFVNKAGAIVLMGTNFGALLQAKSTSCSVEQSIPAGYDLLTVSMARLRLISEEIGRPNFGTCEVPLVDGVWWNEPHKSLTSVLCTCTSQVPGKSCLDRRGRLVAQLDRSRKKSYKGRRKALGNVFELHPEGLVVFGDREVAKRIDARPSTQARVPSVAQTDCVAGASSASQASGSDFVDSGLGTSLPSSVVPDAKGTPIAGASRGSSILDSALCRTSNERRHAHVSKVVDTPSLGPLTKSNSSMLNTRSEAARADKDGNYQSFQRPTKSRSRAAQQMQIASHQTTYAAVAAKSRSLAAPTRPCDDTSDMHFVGDTSWRAPEYPMLPSGFTYKSTAMSEVSQRARQGPSMSSPESSSLQAHARRRDNLHDARRESRGTSGL